MTKTDKNEIECAHENLIDSYLSRLKKEYLEGLPIKRQTIISGLEGVLSKTNNELSGFDPNEARKIRKKSKLTQKELADKLGVKQQQISLAETGGEFGYYSNFSEKYLGWLKSQGYNSQE